MVKENTPNTEIPGDNLTSGTLMLADEDRLSLGSLMSSAGHKEHLTSGGTSKPDVLPKTNMLPVNTQPNNHIQPSDLSSPALPSEGLSLGSLISPNPHGLPNGYTSHESLLTSGLLKEHLSHPLTKYHLSPVKEHLEETHLDSKPDSSSQGSSGDYNKVFVPHNDLQRLRSLTKDGIHPVNGVDFTVRHVRPG